MTGRGRGTTATTDFRMPSLGADMESGVLLEWLVHPGDDVHKGDIVAVVDTSKAAVEVECFATGRIKDLLVEPGTRVPVGETLATIEVDASQQPALEPSRAAATQPTPVEPGPAPHAAAAPHGLVTSPLVRRLAAERHVDTSTLTGTGPVGQVTHADVLRHGGERQQPVRVKASPWARRVAAELHVGLERLRGTGPGGAIRADDVRQAARAVPVGVGAGEAATPVRAREATTEAMRATIPRSWPGRSGRYPTTT
jgi:pyruvate dehydrogenase E2 component (dihydrolipoamide acetyltransferase)